MKLLLKVAYDGTEFHGFQYQPSKRTVQGVLTESFSSLFGFPVAVTGCSRTDSGVHALGFCLTVSSNEGNVLKIPTAKFHKAANNILPPDVSVLGAAQVPDSFHPRYDSAGKEYVYKIYDSITPSPFMAGRAMYAPRPMTEKQLELMNEAAQYFVGTHDFTSFMAAGSKIVDAVRTVKEAYVKRSEDNLVSFTVSADGFLYNMVRIMAGTLFDTACGRFSPSDIPKIIESADRARAGNTAAACGLYLNRVFYPAEINWQADID